MGLHRQRGSGPVCWLWLTKSEAEWGQTPHLDLFWKPPILSPFHLFPYLFFHSKCLLQSALTPDCHLLTSISSRQCLQELGAIAAPFTDTPTPPGAVTTVKRTYKKLEKQHNERVRDKRTTVHALTMALPIAKDNTLSCKPNFEEVTHSHILRQAQVSV